NVDYHGRHEWSRRSERNCYRQHWRRGSELHRHHEFLHHCVKPPKPVSQKFDEYGNIRFNDEKARLDNYAIQLQNQPGSTATIIVYGTCAGEGQQRGDRAKDYLVNTRGIDAGRITVIDGGCRADLTVQLWIVPAGATAPAADTSGAISPCPECKRRPAPRRRRGDEE